MIVLGEGNSQQRFPVSGPLLVGRHARCDVRLEHAGVEEEHLRIEDGALVALADCVAGEVPLLRGARRLAVPGIEVRLGTARFSLEDETTEGVSVPTHQLALRAVAKARLHPRVRVVQGPGLGDELELAAQMRPATVGRSSDAALVTNDATVSRQHVRLSRRGADVLVEDLGSQHGTWLGAARLAPNRIAVWPHAKMLRLGTAVVLHLERSLDLAELLAPPPLREVDSRGDVADENTPAPEPAPVGEASAPDAAAPAASAPVAQLVGAAPSPQGKRSAERSLLELLVAIAAAALAVGALGIIAWLALG